jgi:hypothetical protein
MNVRNKLIIAFIISLLFVVTSLAGTLIYYYKHPNTIKPYIERLISTSTGMACTIDTLSFSLDPLYFKAQGISFNPLEDHSALHLEISDLAADMVMEGQFGRKTLVIKHLRIQKLLSHVPDKFVLPNMKPKDMSPSFFSQILGRTVRWFLFRDIFFEEVELSDGQITATFGDGRTEIKGVRAHMNLDHLIDIYCNIVLEWPSQRLLFTAPEFHITTQNAISLVDPQITGFLEATNATFQSPEIDIENIKTKGTIRYSFKNGSLNVESTELQLDGMHLKQALDTSWPPLKAHIQGAINIQDREFNITDIDLNVHETLQLKGNLGMKIGTQSEFRLDILDGYVLSEKLLALLPDKITERVMVSMSGSIFFRGKMSGQRKQKKWDFSGDLQASLNAYEISYMRGKTRFDAKVSGDFRVSGELPRLFLYADLNSEQIRMELGTEDLLMKRVRIEILKGEMDTKGPSLLLPKIRLESSLLTNTHASMVLKHGLLDLKLHGQNVRLIESVQMFGLLPSGWKIDGLSDLEASVTQNKEKGWIFTSQIRLRHLVFENSNAEYVGEGVSFLLKTNGQLDLEKSQVLLDATLNTEEGELLVDRLFLDLSTHGFSSSLDAIYDVSRQTLQLSKYQIGLKNILSLIMKGRLHLKAPNPDVDLSIHMPRTSLSPLFHHFVLGPFQMEKPFLDSLDLAGDISADLNITGSTSEWKITGHAKWHEGRFASGDKALDFSGIDLDLPVWLGSQNNELQMESIRGRLYIQNINTSLLDKQPLNLLLKMNPTGLSVEEPTILKTPGGTIEFGSVLCENIISSKRSIKTSLRLDEIDACSFFSELLPIPVHGTIKGELDAIYLEKNELHSSGQIRAQVFEGEILLSNLSIFRLFSSFPLYKAHIDLKDLNLLDLTKGTSFGEIEGILQGHIHDLEIAYGQPQKFELLLETVESKGINQQISVRAVNNIARIGGGSSPFMGLAGAIASMFQKFPYSKMGIRASLVNDAFKINGTVKEDGQEYLIKRSSFSGVNVVNKNPDSLISFKDMVKRIGRVTASKSDPMID